MLATYGMEIVECGGSIAKHVRAGGTAQAAVAFSRPESRPQVIEASIVLGIDEVDFLELDSGDLPTGAAAKLPFVRLIRSRRPSIVIVQDPVHAQEDLDPGRREIMPIYLEAIALAGREWRVEDDAPHTVDAVYFMTPSDPDCLVDVSDVWDLKEQAMGLLASQMAFSAAGYRKRFSPEVIRTLGADPDLPDPELGRALHHVVDLAFHVSQAVHSHSGLAIAEPYRKMGPYTFDRLPSGKAAPLE